MSTINTKDFIIGTLVGSIVGAASALLLAPKTGKELRGDLNEQAQVVRDRTTQLTSSAMEKGTEWRDVAREKTAHLSKTVSEQAADIRKKIQKDENVDSAPAPAATNGQEEEETDTLTAAPTPEAETDAEEAPTSSSTTTNPTTNS
ncbi:YtxH domain-containing protein [Bacillaceae bacterium SIJ1]|uniref:YtxH domain-containing protein n=1 Tax=Litoribacterium kuwaitense TaxID=1398745 RepID=UPI0013EAFDC4|nr:YtxH domain-containing protein [Litoribacterium kuwaitense]NGP44202.1 YtxH domain-containing protein [Litoribacterium kuwaitense]